LTTDKSPKGAQDEALRLADALDGGKLIDDSAEWADTLHEAAAELRRLHARVQELERAVEAEREACAKVCESFATGCPGYIDDDWARMCADAIRARGAKGEIND